MANKINVEMSRAQTTKLKEPFVITVPDNPDVYITLTKEELLDLFVQVNDAAIAYAEKMREKK